MKNYKNKKHIDFSKIIISLASPESILESSFGVYAVDLLNQKKFDRMVAWNNRRVVDVPIDEGIKTYKNVERKDSLVETALSLDIYLGDNI